MKGKMNDNTVYFQPKIELTVSECSPDVSLQSDVSIYIHIPFCEKKCYFCSIETCQSYTTAMMDNYVDSLISEIAGRMNVLQNVNVKCIHFGGGTPSVINQKQLNKILDTLKKCVPDLKQKEIVFEASPMSINTDIVRLLNDYAKLSLNIGVQTFDSRILQEINRSTDIDELKWFFNEIKKMNLHTVGVDLICNLPLSEQNTTIRDIETALELGINYFSLYPLRMEAKTVLYHNYDVVHSKMASLEKQIQAYEEAANVLLSKGFEQWSIYHFNGSGRDNHLYSRLQINGGEWIGFGAGADSYFKQQIFANTADINKYIESQKAGLSCIEAARTLNVTDRIVRELVYSLRNGKMSKKDYLNRYGQYIYDSFSEIFQMLIQNEYIKETEQEMILTVKGNFNLSLIEKMIFDHLQINRSDK